MPVSFIGGGNCSTRRKPPTYLKSLTNFITKMKTKKIREVMKLWEE